MNGNSFARKKTHFYQSCSQRFLFFWYRDSSKKSIKKAKSSRSEIDIFVSFDVSFKYKVMQNVFNTLIYESIS